MKILIAWIQAAQKWKGFIFILLVILVIGTVASLITRHVFIHDDVNTRPRLAIVESSDAFREIAFRQGVQLYLDTVNREGGYKGRPVEPLIVEETADTAKALVEDKRVIGVVGHFDLDILKQAAPLYEKAHLPVVTPLFLSEPIAGVASFGLDLHEQARFVANYARNIQQQRLMYVIRDADQKFDPLVEPFLEVYKRFETPVRQVWSLSDGPDSDAQLQKIIEEVKNIDIGGIYIAARPELAVRIIKGIRDTANALEIYGPAQLASGTFSNQVSSTFKKDASLLMHGIIAASPVLFDTANEAAQRFQSRYQQTFNQSPDWIATYAYDLARVIFSNNPGVDEIKGITGTLNFVNRQVQIPIQMGIYNGDRLISAPVQLLPIAKGASFNYIEALRQGRVLYVNDRFMFKTNVVYVGVELNEISDLDLQNETALLDLTIWFRYRGNFSPQDLEVFNGIEPVKLSQPEESKEGDDVQYRRYRIKQKFRFNFTEAKRTYGQHVAGISFRHARLNYNNLMYVVDVMGMPTGNALITDLHQRKVVKARTGWTIDNAWESQDLVPENSEGAPQYVGMTGELPLFSKITLGVVIKRATANARDVIPGEFFIYIAIFGVIGTVFAFVLDVRQWGKYWLVHSWLLRLIFWPLAVLSVGNLTLDWAFSNLSPSSTRIFVVIYEGAWWVMGARLIDFSLRRFVWDALAQHSDYRVPNVIRLFASVLIYSFAFSGIMLVVFNRSPTSLLATSGVLAMVIGMAVKDIIANVFSGIILNFERPFKVGDQIKINNVIGDVKDINWRTTRVESKDGQMVSLANAKVTEAFMENYSLAPNGLTDELHFYTRPEADPKLVMVIINEALAHSKTIVRKKAPSVKYAGVVNVNSYWVADYVAKYQVENLSKKSAVKEELWLYVRQKFVEQDISLIPIDTTQPSG